jgi:hypothetical protein
MPFYIRKGTGSRAFDHLVAPDATRKYARIKEIAAGGRSRLWTFWCKTRQSLRRYGSKLS